MKIKDTDLRNWQTLKRLATETVSSWDQETLVSFAESELFQVYQYDIDRAVDDANHIKFKV